MQGRKLTREEFEDIPGITEDLIKHEKEWKSKRTRSLLLISLAGIFVLTIAANLLFSPGRSSPGISVAYNHFLHKHSEMTIYFEPVGTGSVEVIAIPYLYMQNFKLSRIEPQPIATYLSRGVMMYRFQDGLNQTVAVHLVPISNGPVEGAWKLNDGIIKLSHFIYP